MIAGRPRLRSLATLGFAAAMGASASCLQEDDFVDEFAVLVCRTVVQCGITVHLPGGGELPDTRTECEAAMIEHYSTCSEGCRMVRRKARRCLRRLEDNHCASAPQANDGDAGIPWVCDDVFRGCDPEVVEQRDCIAPTCAVVPQRDAPLGGLALLGVGLWVRRRRLRSR
jgi:hypothetical protein